MGTALALETDGLRTQLRRSWIERYNLAGRLVEARDRFAAGEMDAGLAAFVHSVEAIATAAASRYCRLMLAECATRLGEFGWSRPEYAVLAVVALEQCGK